AHVAWVHVRKKRTRSSEKNVSLTYELTAYIKHTDGKSPVFFEEVEEYNMPVVAGIASTREQFAEALGCGVREMSDHFLQALDHPIPNKQVSKEEAPVQEEVIT